jgi:uncharacterized protein
MIKYLVLLAVIALIFWLVTAKSRDTARRARREAQLQAERQAGRPTEDMVRCAQCGVFLPRTESIGSRGLHFCSREHERMH